MSKRLNDALTEKQDNYILPFLWLHGEDENTLRTEIQKIHECKIGAFCVESRPHPDFVGEQWWKDMNIIIDEAKKLNMKIWILDDSHFPTGTAAGHAAICSKENRKSVLGCRFVDIVGPLNGCSFIPPYEVEIDELLYVIAASHDGEKYLDVTDDFIDGRLYFDVPDGDWRIYYFYINFNCIHSPHINHLRAGGAKVLLDAVYEPHFKHYSSEFGKTIAGFFSDEPGFFSCENGFASYTRTIGDEHYSLPWDNDMESILTKNTSFSITEMLPALADNSIAHTEKKACIRYHYMNTITKLYEKNFTNVIGDWCREHGIEYMGHITEDNNCHSKTGLSAGHFYRAMNGQDYSGCDLVFHQILPGMENCSHAAFTGFFANETADGEFFSYSLYNMTSSLSQIDDRKKGRAMCELFGAYGWGEGCKLMKWMADFMLVRGINHFVPHAFSPKKFPDDDCPPHFYAHGLNPQFDGFKTLMPYINRVSHLISGGHHDAQIAVLYSGDFEWMGNKNTMLSQKPCSILAHAQLQYHIIPFDCLANSEANGKYLLVNEQRYKILIVPFTTYLPYSHMIQLSRLAKSGVTVVFTEDFPGYIINEQTGEVNTFIGNDLYRTIKLSNLADFCNNIVSKDLIFSDNAENLELLQLYAYKHDDSTVYILNNSHPVKTISAEVTITKEGVALEYDAYSNKVFAANKQFTLTLPAYQSAIYIVSNSIPNTVENKPVYQHSYTIENVNWNISKCNMQDYPKFEQYDNRTDLINYNRPKFLSSFSGILCYETEFDFNCTVTNSAISISGTSETAAVWVNGKYCGLRIAPPYIFDTGNALKKGKNTLRIETRNTLYNSIEDIFSRYLPIEAIGITDYVKILY